MEERFHCRVTLNSYGLAWQTRAGDGAGRPRRRAGGRPLLVDQGAEVTVTDLRAVPSELQPSLDALAGLPVAYVLGEHRDEDFPQPIWSSATPASHATSRYLQIARAAGAAIEMEMTLFFRLCPGPDPGITGTKGKTTTTLLTAAMLRDAPDTVVAGNLRVSALEALPRITASTRWWSFLAGSLKG